MFYGSRSNEDPKYFLDEDYKILSAMGVTTGEKAELPPIKSKM